MMHVVLLYTGTEAPAGKGPYQAGITVSSFVSVNRLLNGRQQ